MGAHSSTNWTIVLSKSRFEFADLLLQPPDGDPRRLLRVNAQLLGPGHQRQQGRPQLGRRIEALGSFR